MTRLYTFFLLILPAYGLHAQKIEESLLHQATVLSKTYTDTELIALHATSRYDFSLDKDGHSLIAKLNESEQYLALANNSTLVRKNYFNDKSYVESYSLRSEKGKKLVHDKFCGHYEQGGIFYSDAQVCAYHLVMDLKGRSVFFESSTVFSDPRYLTHVFFHEDVPVKKREVVINVPEWVQVELLEMNFDGYDIEKTVSRENGITAYTYRLNDVKNIPDIGNLPGHLHFLPSVLILTKSYTQNGKMTSILSSTEDLYKWYSSLTSTIESKPDELKPLVTKLVQGAQTDRDKIKAIYYWVQDNIQYIAFEDGLAAFKPEDAHKVLYNRYGDCKGMANLTKEMLTVAGFDARLSWIGTNRVPYSHDIPSLCVDNHMVCSVFYGNEYYILDPTEKYGPFGTNAERIQGKEILIEDGNSFILKKVPVEPLANYLHESSWQYRLENGTLKGTGKTSIDGEFKKALIRKFQEIKEERQDIFLQHVISGAANPDDFKIRDRCDFDRDKTLQIAFAMDLQKNAYTFDNEIYLDLDFEDSYKGNTIDKDRHLPFSFGSKSFRKVNAELVLPDGYGVHHLPEAVQFKNDYFSFDVRYQQTGRKIVYSKEIMIFNEILPVGEFNNWNAVIDKMNTFYNDQIILKAK